MTRLMHKPFELQPWDWELFAEHRAEADELHARAKRDYFEEYDPYRAVDE